MQATKTATRKNLANYSNLVYTNKMRCGDGDEMHYTATYKSKLVNIIVKNRIVIKASH
jgi:hypothetical protein